MSAVKEVFSILAAKAEEAIPVRDCDYLGEDGLLICGKCHTPKQCRPFPGSDLAVYCLCKCQQEEDRAMQERLRRNQIEQRRTICFGTSDLIRATFAEDDGKNPKLTEVCKTFSANLNDSSSWLLLWGDCGTGKSYMAACIANAAIDAGMSVRFITVPDIEQQLWRELDKSAVYDELNVTTIFYFHLALLELWPCSTSLCLEILSTQISTDHADGLTIVCNYFCIDIYVVHKIYPF